MRAMLAVILGSSFLAACGGGGGGGTTTPPPASLLAITATNQDAVGRATATAGTSLVGVSGGVSANASDASAASASVAVATRGTPSITSLARYMAYALSDANSGRRKLLAAGTAMPSTTPAPATIEPDTTLCSVSGSITISFVDADNNSIPSIGDTMTMAFSQCREIANETINGSMSVTLSRIDFTNQLLSFAGSLAVQQLTVVQGTRTSLLNGAINMTYTQRSPTEDQFLLIVGAAGMTTTVSGNSYSDTVSFEPNFTMDQVETIGNPTFTNVSLNGGFSASSIGGRLVLETPVPILQLAGEAYPRSGTMRVVGNGSALRMQALDASTIRFELDANLDGNYEASKDVAWATLLPG